MPIFADCSGARPIADRVFQTSKLDTAVTRASALLDAFAGRKGTIGLYRTGDPREFLGSVVKGPRSIHFVPADPAPVLERCPSPVGEDCGAPLGVACKECA
jgi:hypothetical protein